MRRGGGAPPKTAALGQGGRGRGTDFRDAQEIGWFLEILGEEEVGAPWCAPKFVRCLGEQEEGFICRPTLEGDTGTQHIAGPAPGGSPTQQQVPLGEANPPWGAWRLTSSDPRGVCICRWVHGHTRACVHTHMHTYTHTHKYSISPQAEDT